MLRKFLLFGILSAALSASNRWDDEGREWWKNVEYLASDDMEGRYIGTHGYDLAADYVAEQYERSGLEAAGGDGYFQKVLFAQTELTFAKVRLIRPFRSDGIEVPSELLIYFNPHTGPVAKGRVVFAGYGLKIPEANYDDLQGLPIKGAIVAYLAGAPDNVPANLRAHYSSEEMRWKAYEEAGAIGMIAIQNPKSMEGPWAQQAASIKAPQIMLADSVGHEYKGLQFAASWNPLMAEDLFQGSGHRFAEILEADAERAALPHFAIGCTLKADLSVASRMIASKNVVAVHPGNDKKLKDEFVVISAHLDHLGVDKLAPGHRIFHGAMDDASGVSSVIQIAKMLKNVPTKRSLIFLAFTGEEKGELGSKYFAKHPSVNGRIVADLNMDMFLPLFPLKWLEVQGLDESTLGSDVKRVAEEAGVKVQADKEPDQNRLTRSDHYSFIKAGVPALAFKFGYQKGEPEEQVFHNWFSNRYHSLSDDAQQPVNFEAAAKFNELLKTLLVRVADADAAPKWRDDSFFKRFATTPGI